MPAKRRTNSEGILSNVNLKELLKDLRGQQKALKRDLIQAKERAKAIKAELEECLGKIGSTIDEIDQPALPFSDNNEHIS
jgi:hypothetical protein